MPELPEIETIKLQLQKHLVGQKISSLKKLHPKSVSGDIGLVKGMRVIRVRRIGKMLVLDLEKDLHIAIHFKMTGQLVLKKPKIKNSRLSGIHNAVNAHSSQTASGQKSNLKNTKKISEDRIIGGPARNAYSIAVAGGHPTKDWIGKLPSKHTRAIFHFSSGDTMFFNDQRIFGWIKILDSKTIRQLRLLRTMGKEPWDMTDTDFYSIIHKRQKAIKLILMDQELISGAGNIYANDALWEAGIDPRLSGKTLRQEDSKTLRQSLIKVLKEGIKYGGATAKDDKYVNLDGLGGSYQKHFRVYDREGERCLRDDGGIIKKIKLGGRGTYFCPKCQR